MKCIVCKKDATNQCVSCTSIWYCGRDCQKSDWKTHKKNCPYLKEFSPEDFKEISFATDNKYPPCVFICDHKQTYELINKCNQKDQWVIGPDEENYYYGLTSYGVLRLNAEDWSELLYRDLERWLKTYKTPSLGEEFTEDHQIALCIEMIKMHTDAHSFTGFDLCKNKNEQNKYEIEDARQKKEEEEEVTRQKKEDKKKAKLEKK